MKTLSIKRLCVTLLAGLASTLACAQDSVEGTWAGSLEVAPGTQIEVQFDLSRNADGTWSAVLNSPDTGAIKDVEASSASFSDGQLAIEVQSLSGNYNGSLAEGTITGTWSQPGAEIPLVLTPFEARSLTAEDMAQLLGEWYGTLEIPGQNFTIAFYFEVDEEGAFKGFIENIDAGGGRAELTDIAVDDDELFFRIPSNSAEYRGTLAGGTLSGAVLQAGQSFPLNSEKGTRDQAGADDGSGPGQLQGNWVGTLDTPQQNFTIVIAFGNGEGGELQGTIENTDAGNGPQALSDITLDGESLSFLVTSTGTRFQGTLSGNELNGSVTLGNGGSAPMRLSRSETVPQRMTFGLGNEDFEKLQGDWVGEVLNLTVVLHVFRNEAGQILMTSDSPDQGANDMHVSEASLDGNDLSFSVPVIQASWTGVLDGDTLTGTLNQRGATNPLNFERVEGEYVHEAPSVTLTESNMAILEGSWTGELGPLTLVFNFRRDEAGNPVVTIDSPDQNANDIPVPSASMDGDTLTLEQPALTARFVGTVEGSSITGTWSQGGGNSPLTVTKQE